MAQRKSQGFRPTERIAKHIAWRATGGVRVTDTINQDMTTLLDAQEALRAEAWWKILQQAEAENVSPGTLLGRLALAGLKGAKR